jgi:hypothetical protein
MHFANPIWLPIGAVVSVTLLVLLLRAEHLKSKALLVLAGSRTRQAALPDTLTTPHGGCGWASCNARGRDGFRGS